MKRAKLIPEEVLHIVVGSTMTDPDEVFESPEEQGMHFYIPKDGAVIDPVPDDLRGNYLPRYGSNSIVIIIEGGYDEDGHATVESYNRGQLLTVKAIAANMLKKYPKAEIRMWHELRMGINPVIDIREIT